MRQEEVLAFAKEQGVSVRNLDVTRKLAHQISGFSEKPVRVAHNWTESGAIVLAERRMYAALGSVLFAEKPSDWFKVSKKRR